MKPTSIRKFLPEFAIGLSLLAIGGVFHFSYDYGALKSAFAESEKSESKLDEKVDEMAEQQEERWKEQRQVNREVLRSLSRIEGRLQEEPSE